VGDTVATSVAASVGWATVAVGATSVAAATSVTGAAVAAGAVAGSAVDVDIDVDDGAAAHAANPADARPSRLTFKNSRLDTKNRLFSIPIPHLPDQPPKPCQHNSTFHSALGT
jgi:hypothetical protein